MTIEQIVEDIIKNNPEDEVHERIYDLKLEFLDPEDVENDFDGDIDEAYIELGRGEAEATLLQELLTPYNLEGDDYVDAHDQLCEIWNLSTY